MIFRKTLHKDTYYFWILCINAVNMALISAVFCGENVTLNVLDNRSLIFGDDIPPWGSCGPTRTTTSGNMLISMLNVFANWSSSVLRGSTFVGERQASSADFIGGICDDNCCSCCSVCWSLLLVILKLSDCFFLLLGVLLDVRKRRDRRSPPPSLAPESFGGLLAAIWSAKGVFGMSGSVDGAPSLPELSFFHSPLRSKKITRYLFSRISLTFEQGVKWVVN